MEQEAPENGDPKENVQSEENRAPEPETMTLVDDANLAAKRLENANIELKAQLDRQEAMAVKATLGGKADTTAKPKEEDDADYAKRVAANDL